MSALSSGNRSEEAPASGSPLSDTGMTAPVGYPPNTGLWSETGNDGLAPIASGKVSELRSQDAEIKTSLFPGGRVSLDATHDAETLDEWRRHPRILNHGPVVTHLEF